MRVLLYGQHRYPGRRDDGTGLDPRPAPSDADTHILDLLAHGLAEQGHEVDYLLPAGVDAALPDGVRHASSPPDRVDVAHNLEIAGRPWVVTVHAHRSVAGYYDRYVDGALVPPAPLEGPAADLPANAICVSRSLTRSLGGTRYVHNGLDPADYIYSATKDDYLLFMAGMQGHAIDAVYRGKGLEDALRLSQETGLELIVAGTTRERQMGERIATLCREAGARYLGDVRGPHKAELLAGARALLFPTHLDEGFGLVIAEALMSGTPVIASDRGACPELISPEVGFVCADDEEYRSAIEDVGRVAPEACRAKALTDYHYRRMAADYVREYEREIDRALPG